MQLGVGLPSFSSDTHAIPPGRLQRFARHAEEYGFAGAWVIEHLIPPPTYATSLLDPLTTLATVAGATETLPVGTSVLLLPLRNPVLVAKRAATIQHLSERQLTLGLGTGYVDAEFDAVGVPIQERSARFLEGIELLSWLLSGDTVTFDGEFYSVEDFQLEPSLRRRPRLLAGGGGVDRDDGRTVVDSVRKRLAHADGWIAPPRPTDVLASDWSDFAEYLDANGRDPNAVDRVALQYLHLVPEGDTEGVKRTQRKAFRGLIGPDRSVEEAETNWLVGTVETIHDELATYEQMGFDQLILHPVVREPAELDRQLRLWRDLVKPEYP